MRTRIGGLKMAIVALAFVLAAAAAQGQTCETEYEIEPATLKSVHSTVQSFFESARAGNYAALQPSAEFNLGDLLTANKELLNGTATIRSTYVLDNPADKDRGTRAEFLCGIYNSPDRVVFIFGGLPPGRYAVVMQDVTGKPSAVTTWILRQSGATWKIAGLYIRGSQIAGRDATWYLNKARDFRSKGQKYNAWFYYTLADSIMRPFPAMSTPQLEKLYDEMQAARPADLPSGNVVDLTGQGGRTFQVTSMFATPVGDNLDVVVKYRSPDISDNSKAYQDNMAVIKAVVARYPELRDVFSGIVARAVAPDGAEYGSLLPMEKAIAK